MTTVQVTVIGGGLFCLTILLSGYRLSRLGKPYGALLFNAHKLIGVAAFVCLVITISQINQEGALSAAELVMSVVAALSFVSAGVTGGLVSIDRSLPAPVSMLHRVLPYLTVFATASTLYLLLTRS